MPSAGPQAAECLVRWVWRRSCGSLSSADGVECSFERGARPFPGGDTWALCLRLRFSPTGCGEVAHCMQEAAWRLATSAGGSRAAARNELSCPERTGPGMSIPMSASSACIRAVAPRHLSTPVIHTIVQQPGPRSSEGAVKPGTGVVADLLRSCRTCRVQRRRYLSAGQCQPRDEAQLRFANNRLAAPESRA